MFRNKFGGEESPLNGKEAPPKVLENKESYHTTTQAEPKHRQRQLTAVEAPIATTRMEEQSLRRGPVTRTSMGGALLMHTRIIPRASCIVPGTRYPLSRSPLCNLRSSNRQNSRRTSYVDDSPAVNNLNLPAYILATPTTLHPRPLLPHAYAKGV